ncbi:hypothetical protein J7I93_00445 [Bacillus sp. ISL-47]|uniref:hypothetical protein n=1 Tax=Bacillus sp. ISL-47 TaxID=2819130 RepID=UPI001BE6A1C1|nr:hypothetical protein [Bacillus sp. ISL-47]MBT2686645.1 hypothetical protein [Bacillus sp. ISL-47]MBT2707037.1 hypothetical protein [Pseudomonas sp. ISL-84]
MNVSESKSLRIKQIHFLNGSLLFFLTIGYFVTSFIDITFTQMFLFLGVIILIQAIVGWVKRNSTKSFFSVVEQIAIYEKERMGSEWEKQRKSRSIWSFIMSVLLFFNAYVLNRTGEFVKFDLTYLFFLAAGMLVVMNISYILHSRKVDDARAKSDFKGYTRKMNLKSIVIGSLFGIILFIFTIVYVMSGY